jgi:hypothetical protein
MEGVVHTSSKHALNEVVYVAENDAIPFRTIIRALLALQWLHLQALQHHGMLHICILEDASAASTLVRAHK